MLLKKIVITVVTAIVSFSLSAGEWTWVHQRKFNEIVRITNGNKKRILIEENGAHPFTQLIFSWNALRPEKGYFSFYVQVRDMISKKWGIWHHMVDWGANVQHSYLSKSDGISFFAHVRLEIENRKYADAFRIKIEAQNGASLALLHGIYSAISDFPAFQAETKIDALASTCVADIPATAQFALNHEDKHRICSPVSCSMMVHYLTGSHTDPIDFALGVFDSGLNVYGSWPYNIAHAFDYCGGKINFCVRRMNSFVDIYTSLMKKLPVIVSVRGNLPGALKPFPHGHLMVVVGWDNDTREVLCHDPAAEDHAMVFKRYPIKDFLKAWEASHRLSYVAECLER